MLDNNLNRRFGKWLAILGSAAGVVLPAQAIVFDWDSALVVWTDGALTGSFDIDPNNNGYGDGKDVKITISGSTSRLNFGSPREATYLQGGIIPAESSLGFSADFTAVSESITVTIEFMYTQGVSEASFTLFDIDKDSSGEQDKVSGGVSTYLGAGTSYATYTTSAKNTLVNANGTAAAYVRGSGDAADTGNTSGQGNLGFDFSTNTLDKVVFKIGTADTSGNPSQQLFGLYDISYRPKPPVPEVHPGLLGIVGAGLFLGLRRRLGKRS